MHDTERTSVLFNSRVTIEGKIQNELPCIQISVLLVNKAIPRWETFTGCKMGAPLPHKSCCVFVIKEYRWLTGKLSISLYVSLCIDVMSQFHVKANI